MQQINIYNKKLGIKDYSSPCPNNVSRSFWCEEVSHGIDCLAWFVNRMYLSCLYIHAFDLLEKSQVGSHGLCWEVTYYVDVFGFWTMTRHGIVFLLKFDVFPQWQPWKKSISFLISNRWKSAPKGKLSLQLLHIMMNLWVLDQGIWLANYSGLWSNLTRV